VAEGDANNYWSKLWVTTGHNLN